MYQSNEEQMQRQMDALQSVRDRAVSDPGFARKFLQDAGLFTSPDIKDQKNCTPVREESNAKSPAK
jgi:hypothetical protein